MLSVTLLAAAGWLFSRGALRGLPPLLFLGVRFSLAALLLAAVAWRALRGLTAGAFLRGLLTGAVMAVAMVCWIQGLARATQLGVGAFICSLGVILVPVVGRVFFGARVPARTWAAAAVGAVGLALLSLRVKALAGSDAFFAASAAASALHFNLNVRFAGQMSIRALTTLQLAVVGVVCLALSAAGERWPAALDAPTVGYVAASVVLCTSLRFLLQVRAQSLAPLGHAALLMALEPVWTALLAAAVLGERMAPLQLVGCGLIAAALVANRLGPGYPRFLSEEG